MECETCKKKIFFDKQYHLFCPYCSGWTEIPIEKVSQRILLPHTVFKNEIKQLMHKFDTGLLFIVLFSLREQAARSAILDIRTAFSEKKDNSFREWFTYSFLITFMINNYHISLESKSPLPLEIKKHSLTNLHDNIDLYMHKPAFSRLLRHAKNRIEILNERLLVKNDKGRYFLYNNQEYFLLDTSNPIMKFFDISKEEQERFMKDFNFYGVEDAFTIKYELEGLYIKNQKEIIQSRIVKNKLREVYSSKLLPNLNSQATIDIYNTLLDVDSIINEMQLNNNILVIINSNNRIPLRIFNRIHNFLGSSIIQSFFTNNGFYTQDAFTPSFILRISKSEFIIPLYSLKLIRVSLFRFARNKETGSDVKKLGSDIEELTRSHLDNLNLTNLFAISDYQKKSKSTPNKYPEIDFIYYNNKYIILGEIKFKIFPVLEELEKNLEKFPPKIDQFRQIASEFGIPKDVNITSVIYSPFYPKKTFNKIPVITNPIALFTFMFRFIEEPYIKQIETVPEIIDLKLTDFRISPDVCYPTYIDVGSAIDGKNKDISYLGTQNISRDTFRITDGYFDGISPDGEIMVRLYVDQYLKLGEYHKIILDVDDFTLVRMDVSEITQDNLIRFLIYKKSSLWTQMQIIDYQILRRSIMNLSGEIKDQDKSTIKVFQCGQCKTGAVAILKNTQTGSNNTITLICNVCENKEMIGDIIYVNENSSYIPIKLRKLVKPPM